MANSLEEIIKKKERLAQTFRDLPAICGEEMLNFTFENFEKKVGRVKHSENGQKKESHKMG